MEARCYRGGDNRTRLNELVLSRRDLLPNSHDYIFIGHYD